MRSLLDKRQLTAGSSQDFTPNLLPLIDVVFLLLVFFVISSTFIRHKHLNIDLPQIENTSQLITNAKEVIVLIDAKGNYAVNGKFLANNKLTTLIESIQAASNNNNTLPLAISADANTPYQVVVSAMDVVGKMGFLTIRLSTRDSDATQKTKP